MTAFAAERNDLSEVVRVRCYLDDMSGAGDPDALIRRETLPRSSTNEPVHIWEIELSKLLHKVLGEPPKATPFETEEEARHYFRGIALVLNHQRPPPEPRPGEFEFVVKAGPFGYRDGRTHYTLIYWSKRGAHCVGGYGSGIELGERIGMLAACGMDEGMADGIKQVGWKEWHEMSLREAEAEREKKND